MKKFLGALKKIGLTALRNAIASPQTTVAGVTAIAGGVSIIAAGGKTPADVSTATISILSGIGLVLADDPTTGTKDE